MRSAQLARQAGQRARAAELLRRSVRRQAERRALTRWSYRADLSPADPDLHLQLGRAYLAAGDAARAVVELRRALELRPNWQRARDALVRARAANGG